jgi:hypothetical protein
MRDYHDLLESIDEDYSEYEQEEGALTSGEIEVNREDFLDQYGEDAEGWNEFQGDTLVVGWYVKHPYSDDPGFYIDGIWSDLMQSNIVKPSEKMEEYILEQIKIEFELLNKHIYTGLYKY